eukprot:TRINITY_DN44_c0_g1_i2.p1 TRINITY_DN44_c0_g1~~TRINITY_DN44_c0_g1_i2.p1  ORF type:complete len:258 (+),score=19.62 TRINITY_DN44_c0_g1_i2:48-776(+)
MNTILFALLLWGSVGGASGVNVDVRVLVGSYRAPSGLTCAPPPSTPPPYSLVCTTDTPVPEDASNPSPPTMTKTLFTIPDAALYLDAIGVQTTGLSMLNISYAGVPVMPGQDFDPTGTDLDSEPLVSWDPALGECTVVMVDPDAPTRNSDGSQPGAAGPWLHWIHSDAVGSTSDGAAIMEYAKPTPPSGMGKHRYIFVLFRQNVQTLGYPTPSRMQWDFPDFLSRYPAMVPVAANFYYAETP